MLLAKADLQQSQHVLLAFQMLKAAIDAKGLTSIDTLAGRFHSDYYNGLLSKKSMSDLAQLREKLPVRFINSLRSPSRHSLFAMKDSAIAS